MLNPDLLSKSGLGTFCGDHVAPKTCPLSSSPDPLFASFLCLTLHPYMLCSPSTRAERAFVEQVTAVNGWVLDYDQQSSRWHIFLFCFLREVFISSEHMELVTSIPMALAINDLVLALRCGSLRPLVDDVDTLERESLQIVAVHSKLLQLQEDGNMDRFTLVVHYRDYLRSLDLDAWLQHVFEPDPSMLPSYLLRYNSSPTSQTSSSVKAGVHGSHR